MSECPCASLSDLSAGTSRERSLPTDLPDGNAYRYWDGSDWVSEPSAAALVLPPAVGELSVRWNDKNPYQVYLVRVPLAPRPASPAD